MVASTLLKLTVMASLLALPALSQANKSADGLKVNAILPNKDFTTLSEVEQKIPAFPHLSAGWAKGKDGKPRAAIMSKGTKPKVWLMPSQVLNLFKCEKKACANDAAGTLYELNDEQWVELPTRLRPWSTLVHFDKALSACIKPTVVEHSGVKAYCYAADRSWRYNYMVKGPAPDICKGKLRLIERKQKALSLVEIALPKGTIMAKMPVSEPLKEVCAYALPEAKPQQATEDEPPITMPTPKPISAEGYPSHEDSPQ